MIAYDDDLIERIIRRASNPETRTDNPKNALGTLPPRATAENISTAEADLGFRLPELLARLYGEVANGGFGPGFGIIGLHGGYLENGQSIVEIYNELKRSTVTEWNWPEKLLPFCDWGCAVLTCVDCQSNQSKIVFSEEGQLTPLDCDLRNWLEAWCSGTRLWDQFEQMFDWEDVSIINPFTREPMSVRRRVRTARDCR